MELQIIQQKIFEIRGQKVMFDFDLAALYEVETKRLKEAVKRNIDHFPDDFMFQLTKEEFFYLRSQFATSNKGGNRYLPFAFTEHGITMLSSVLKSEKAVKMNIAIVRAFIALRKFAAQYGELIEQLQELKDRVGNHDAQLNQIYEAIENLLEDKVEQQHEKDTWKNREKIGFKK